MAPIVARIALGKVVRTSCLLVGFVLDCDAATKKEIECSLRGFFVGRPDGVFGADNDDGAVTASVSEKVLSSSNGVTRGLNN